MFLRSTSSKQLILRGVTLTGYIHVKKEREKHGDKQVKKIYQINTTFVYSDQINRRSNFLE